MKQKELVDRLKNAGFVLIRHGANHDIYGRDNCKESIPRHSEINENLAKAIIKKWGVVIPLLPKKRWYI